MKIFKTSLILLLLISTVHAQDKRKVALVPFSNKGQASINWVGNGLEYLLNNKISVISGFFVIDRNIMKKTLKEINFPSGTLNDKQATHIGRVTNAEVTVSGSYSGTETKIELHVFYHNAGTGNQIYKEDYTTNTTDLPRVAEGIIQQLLLISGVKMSSSEEALMKRTLTRNPKAYESFIKAYAETNKSNPNMDVVIGLFRQAIAEDGNFWEAYYNLGIVYFNTHQYDQALAQFNKIIRALPNFDKPYYGRGLIYEKQEKYDLAINDFKKVVEFNPNDYKTYYYLGKISTQNKNYTEAKKYLDEGAAINPDYAPIQFEYGNLLVAQDQMRKSIPFYRQATVLDPDNIFYHETLGEVYYRSQIFYNALAEFQSILKMEPNNAVANFMLGVTIYKQAVLEELVEAFLDMLDEDNTAGRKAVKESKFNKNTTAIDPVKKHKVYEDMVDAFTKASQARPGFMQATFNLALTYFEMGNYDMAERYFKATILIEPDLIKAHTKLAEVYEKTNRKDLAIEEYRRVFYIQPAFFVRQPTLGPEYQYKNILNEFMQELDEKVRRNPNDPNANIALAKVFKAQGYNGKAANILRSILSKNPSNREAKQLLARIEKNQR